MNTFGWSAIVTLALFVITNLGLVIFQYARVTTLLDVVQKELVRLGNQFTLIHGTYSTKEEVKFAKESVTEHMVFAKQSVDKEFLAVWRQIDALKGVRHEA